MIEQKNNDKKFEVVLIDYGFASNYLQKNGKYGGSIDIIKTSHKNFSYYRIILRKIKNIPLLYEKLLVKFRHPFY